MSHSLSPPWYKKSFFSLLILLSLACMSVVYKAKAQWARELAENQRSQTTTRKEDGGRGDNRWRAKKLKLPELSTAKRHSINQQKTLGAPTQSDFTYRRRVFYALTAFFSLEISCFAAYVDGNPGIEQCLWRKYYRAYPGRAGGIFALWLYSLELWYRQPWKEKTQHQQLLVV